MALAFVQGVVKNSTATPAVFPTFGTAIAAGDLIVVLCGGDGGSTGNVNSVTDSLGNTYTQVPSFNFANAGGTLNMDAWYAVVTNAGSSNVVTVSFKDTLENFNGVVQHFNGFTGTATLDKIHTSSNTSSTTCTSGATATTTQATELVIGMGIHASTASAFSLGTDYTNLTTSNVSARATAMESKLVSSTGAQTATFSIAAARVNMGGVLTFYDASSGTLHTQSLTASMTPSGAFTKRTARALTASMLSSGVLTKKAIRAFTASMTPRGSLAKKTIRAFTASLGLSGVLSASHLFFKSLTGAMTPSGLLARRAGKALSGSLPLSGVLAKLSKRNLTGSMTSVGSLTKKTIRSLTGSMTPLGTITGFAHKFTKALTGSMTPTGSLLTGSVFHRSLTASITFTGSVSKQVNKQLSGAFTPSGSIGKQINKLLTGFITFSGLLSKATNIVYRITQLFVSKPSDISLSVTQPSDISLSSVMPADISLIAVAPPDSELTAVAANPSVFNVQTAPSQEITVIKPSDDSVSIIGEA